MMLYKKRLMVPGPTPIPNEVIHAGMQPMIDERTPEFGILFSRLLNNLKEILNTNNDILIFSSSITGACESTIQNLFSSGDRVLIINNGFFAERWIEICKAYGVIVEEIKCGFGQEIDFTAVANKLSLNQDIIATICVFCETSTGMMNDIERLSEIAKGTLTIVDAASGVGVSEIKTDQWNIDVVVSGSQKALMTPPGISFVSVSQRAWQAHRSATLPRFYFDWGKSKKFSQEKYPHTPFTPAISLIFQLDMATTMILNEGLENVYNRHAVLSKATREGMKALGLKLLIETEEVCSAVTAAFLPEGLSAEDFVEDLSRRFGIQITDGAGVYKDKIIRIGHCGYMDPFEIIATISAIEALLVEYDSSVILGEAIKKVQQVFANISTITMMSKG
ncbi:alanine--glyoxylate aminotransferase family protein [Bacillus toyonensis]|uniref:Alanine--glyoxylate aminotransferase family protein n=2 Tax=Bacillaceae TaxID=186817 RepID=A0AAP8EZA8_9BACI|nr:alanine--glyoxylate aminotransferase family protein [Bacillus toyonensis]PEE27744.1 alanine--glyoxylate aminotransferase family protein [Bacillus toyonensis]PEF79773.1 alanine--glyoxylate aminotransferase family protein [Bacillus toyonensis]PEL00907.1 alanine--glyoxylate aminotransferase family protein [Bacillus toyonensis]PEO29026.1 alanine--glyoxylate aminotransferase family protein [Bacillus toyonensis]